MASESFFRNTFCAEIIAAYSKERFTNSRMQAVWNSVKHFSDEALAIALKEVTKTAMFPGADKIIESCATANGNVKAAEIAKVKASGECSFCSNGIRQVNGFTYRCTCKIGQITYPNLPLYDGQAPWVDKHSVDSEGNVVIETLTHIYRRSPEARSIKDFSFTLKASNAFHTPKQDFNKPKLIKADRYDPENF